MRQREADRCNPRATGCVGVRLPIRIPRSGVVTTRYPAKSKTTMDRWREKADEMFPELASRFDAGGSPYSLWLELRGAFEEAYDKTPPDESLITRIYRYSVWCCDQPRRETAEDDLLTCVSVSFYEHIPLHPKARQDMPRWWQSQDFDDGPDGRPNILRYHLTAERFEELRQFLDKEKDRYEPDLW